MSRHKQSKSISTTLSDQELLGELKKGYAEAAAILYMRYSEALIRYGKRRGLTTEEAEDAVNDTFSERLVRNMWKYDPTKGSVRSWIFYVLYRSAIREMRDARSPTVPFDDIEGDLFRPWQSIEDEAEEIALWAAYDAIMLSISDWDWYEIYRGPGTVKDGRKDWRDVVYRYKEALCERFCGIDTSIATRCFWKLTPTTR